jgi:hypothetical protein
MCARWAWWALRGRGLIRLGSKELSVGPGHRTQTFAGR